MTDEIEPGLFGLQNNSNRDFRLRDTWGKNQFNSSFPVALCCYMHNKKVPANYICLDAHVNIIKNISIKDIFGIDPNNEDVYFSFESQFTPFNRYVIGSLPRTDLVVQSKSSGNCFSGLEVKLTALPDNITCELAEKSYGSEIVVRPDTIVYLACSIASSLGGELGKHLPNISILNWEDANEVIHVVPRVIEAIAKIAFVLELSQVPFLLQPIWKTKSKSPELDQNCLQEQ